MVIIMKKLRIKSIVSVLLAIAMIFGMFSSQVLAANVESSKTAGASEFFIEKLVEVGMRTAAETCDKIGEATGNEDVEKLFSFVSNWVFSDGAEASAAKIIKLCEEILEELKNLEEDIEEGFSVVEGMSGENLATQAKDSLENQWEVDVESIIRTAKVSNALDTYKKYMDDSTKYNPYGELGVEKATLEKDLDNLLTEFLDICSENTDMNTSKDDKLRTMFYSNKTNTVFKQLIHDLSAKLNDTDGGSVYQHAGKYAWASIPFSHQQHQFIYSYAQKQIYEIILVCMLYNEYLFQQGNYIAEHTSDYKNSQAYTNFLSYQQSFGDEVSNTLAPNIATMLNSKIQVATNETLTLDSLMKQEDFGEVNLDINEYQDEYGFQYNPNNRDYDFYSNSQYIKETNRFNRIATRSGNKNYVYYILDPTQFSSEHSTNAIVMDTKCDIKGGFDVHVSSADYHNLTQRTMSDGANTFKNQTDIYPLFNTNYFRICNSSPSMYLGSLIPNHSGGTTLLMTPEYENDYLNVFATSYAEYKVVDCSKSIDGTTVETKKYSGKDFQLDHGGEKYYYSVVLSNQGSDYYQNLRIKAPENIEVSVTDSSGNTLIGDTRNETSSDIQVKSGEMLTFKFKPIDGYSISSFKCIRNNVSQTISELFGYDDKDIIKKEGDYYFFNYPMPYSDSTFDISEIYDEKELEIYTAQDLIDFSEKVNSGYVAKAKLCADIDLSEDICEFKPIGTNDCPFNGIFDGQNHTVSGLNISDNFDCVGLFGKSVGTIKNLIVKGRICLYKDQSCVGGVVGSADGGEISNVESYVDITNEGCRLSHVGGVVGSVENNVTVIEKCAYYGNLKIYYSIDCIGGVIGYTNHGANIKNCANLGTVYVTESDAYVGGILGYANNTYYTLSNCYNYGVVTNGGRTYYCGAIIGWAKDYGDGNITNNYYLSSSAQKAFGTKSKAGLSAIPCSVEEFKSGKVAFLLNKGNTTPVWHQNIDKGNHSHDYPVFAGETVNFICEDIYSNKFLGDADKSGGVTVLDATYLQKWLAKMISDDDIDLSVCDTDKDKKVSILDVTQIQKYLAGIIREF